MTVNFIAIFGKLCKPEYVKVNGYNFRESNSVRESNSDSLLNTGTGRKEFATLGANSLL